MYSKVFCLILLLLLISCSVNPARPNPTYKSPGFLPDYSLLKQVSDTNEAYVYRYINPQVKRSDYNAVIIDPVVLYQPAGESVTIELPKAVDNVSATRYVTRTVTKDKIEQTRQVLNDYLNVVVGKAFPIVQESGVGVAHLSVAITGAEIDKDGFQIRNLIPISDLIRITSMVTGLDNKRPVLVVEVKIVDSHTGILLGEAYNIISGEKFRVEVHTTDEFQKLAKQWVDTAVKYAASNNPRFSHNESAVVEPILHSVPSLHKSTSSAPQY